MISIDGSLFIQIVNFVFLIWILNIVLYKPIRKVLLQRKDKISGLERNIQTSLRDAKEKDEAVISGIRDAREMGLKEKEALILAATEDEKRVIQEIHEKAQTDLNAVREQIARESEHVKEALLKEIDGFAQAIGEKILGRTV